LATINGVMVRSDGVVFSSRLGMGDDHSIAVEVGESHIDRHGHYYVFGGGAPGKAGMLPIYSHDDRLDHPNAFGCAPLGVAS
jgi:hypothetical protein